MSDPRDTHYDRRPETAPTHREPKRQEEASPQGSDFSEISNGAKRNVQQRGLRRAIAINAVEMAKTHAGREQEPFSQQEADVIVAIMELLDRIATP